MGLRVKGSCILILIVISQPRGGEDLAEIRRGDPSSAAGRQREVRGRARHSAGQRSRGQRAHGPRAGEPHRHRPGRLILIDSTPVGDSLLDPPLAAIAAGEQRDARYWVSQTALRAAEIREEALSHLAERGILEHHEGRFLWVFRSRRYPVIDGKAELEVKRRILGVLLSHRGQHSRHQPVGAADGVSRADAEGGAEGARPSRRPLPPVVGPRSFNIFHAF